METKIKPVVGSIVKFYDSDMANRDKDYSGKNPKYYPIGEVIAVYIHHSKVGNYSDEVCDIKIGDRISKGHFITGVEVQK